MSDQFYPEFYSFGIVHVCNIKYVPRVHQRILRRVANVINKALYFKQERSFRGKNF